MTKIVVGDVSAMTHPFIDHAAARRWRTENGYGLELGEQARVPPVFDSAAMAKYQGMRECRTERPATRCTCGAYELEWT